MLFKKVIIITLTLIVCFSNAGCINEKNDVKENVLPTAKPAIDNPELPEEIQAYIDTIDALVLEFRAQGLSNDEISAIMSDMGYTVNFK